MAEVGNPRCRRAGRRRAAAAAAWGLAGGLLLAVGAGCRAGGQESAAADSTTTAAATAGEPAAGKLKKKEKAIRVDVAAVRRGELVVPVFADGAIRTPRSLEVRSKVGGELVRVDVRDGDRVRAGQVLARIDQRQYVIDLQENRYQHIEALSRVAAEDDSFEVNREALGRFTAAREALEGERRRGRLGAEAYRARLLELELAALREGAFRQDLFEQRTGLAEARAAEDRARLDLDNTEIRAPFAGVVQGVAVVEGEIISPGAAICHLYDNDHLEASVHVLEADLGNLEVGRPVLLAIPATGDTLEVGVDVLSPQLDAATRTCEVIIRFDNPAGRLRPGMFVRAEIAGWIYPERLLVPAAAVLTRDARTLVFKVQDDRAQWLYVDTGLQNSDWIEITGVHSGGTLAAGDRVVVSDHLTLAHEARIKVRRTRPPHERWSFAAGAGAEPPR